MLVQDTLILSAPSSNYHYECSKVFLSHFPSHHLDPVWPLCWGHHPSPILPPLSLINLSSKISIDHVRVELHHSFPTLLQHPFHVPSVADSPVSKLFCRLFTYDHQITVIFHELTSICMQFFLELPMYEIDNEREITLNYKLFISLNYLMLLELSLLQWFFDFLISVHGSNLSLASCSSSVYSSVRWMKLLNKEK